MLSKIIREPCFPKKPLEAINIGHYNAENFFLELAESGKIPTPPKPGDTSLKD
jgi:hypothetical protein